MKVNRLKFSVIFIILGLVIFSSCQQQAPIVSAQNLRDEIAAMQDKLFNNPQQALDIAKADSMIMLYKKYAIEYPKDSLSANYLFKAAEVEMGVEKNQNCSDSCHASVHCEVIHFVIHAIAYASTECQYGKGD